MGPARRAPGETGSGWLGSGDASDVRSAATVRRKRRRASLPGNWMKYGSPATRAPAFRPSRWRPTGAPSRHYDPRSLRGRSVAATAPHKAPAHSKSSPPSFEPHSSGNTLHKTSCSRSSTRLHRSSLPCSFNRTITPSNQIRFPFVILPFALPVQSSNLSPRSRQPGPTRSPGAAWQTRGTSHRQTLGRWPRLP